MKKLLLLLLFTSQLIFGNNDKTLSPSKIKSVTVYLSGAQVTRTASVKVPVGTTAFTFNKLSPFIEEQSIQISGLEEVSVLGVNFGINHLSKHDFSGTIDSIHVQIKLLKDKIQLEDNIIAGYQEELNLIKANRSLGNDNNVVNLDKLKAFSEYYRKQLTLVNNEVYASQKRQQDYQSQINDLAKQLSEYKLDEKIRTGEITVKLNAKTATAITLELKYNVLNAGWFPVYDLKADKINEPLDLAYKAHIFQNTGVKWEDVKLILSTSDPNTNNLKPDVNPKYLNFINPYSGYSQQQAVKRYDYVYNPMVNHVSGTVVDENGLPLPGVNVIVKGTTIGTQTDFDGNYSLDVQSGKALVFSFVGYKSEDIPIHASNINLDMQPSTEMIEEVVITALAISRESSSYIPPTPGEVINQLQGKVSGLSISEIDKGKNVILRGINSLTQDNQPLIVIDGVISSKNDLSNLNKEFIKNVEVLKGSNASALYGSQGTNGVIIFTTDKSYTSTGNIIEEGITNLRFEIKDLHTIKTEEDVTVIDIENYKVPTQFVYFAAPVLNENVFLTAKVTNWEQYNLLPGEANVYFEGSFSGKTMLNPYATKDTLTVSLGIDPNVVVKRNELKDFKSKPFIGSNRILDKAYEIEIRNNKKTNVEIVLIDRIPVSQNKEIKVEDIETGGSNYNSEKGLMEWKMNLNPSESQTKSFSYQLRFPKHRSISL